MKTIKINVFALDSDYGENAIDQEIQKIEDIIATTPKIFKINYKIKNNKGTYYPKRKNAYSAIEDAINFFYKKFGSDFYESSFFEVFIEISDKNFNKIKHMYQEFEYIGEKI